MLVRLDPITVQLVAHEDKELESKKSKHNPNALLTEKNSSERSKGLDDNKLSQATIARWYHSFPFRTGQ